MTLMVVLSRRQNLRDAPPLRASTLGINMIIQVICRGGTVSALTQYKLNLSGVCDMAISMVINKSWRAVVLPLVVMMASIAAPEARAVPIDYTVSYSGSNVGKAFQGSFTWDSDTSRFSNFMWELTPTADTLMAASWRSAVFGGTMGQFLFEILTGEDVHPSACSTTSRCTFASLNVSSSLLDAVKFRRLETGTTEYSFRRGSTVLYSGLLSVSRVALRVSEPFTLLLMGVGLMGLAWNRRRSSAKN